MTPPTPHHTPLRRGISLADLALALGVTTLGGLFLLGTLQIQASTGYSQVGPRFFPYVIATGLLTVGLLLTIDALRGSRAQPAAEEDADPNAPNNYTAMGWITLGILLDMLLMNTGGFVLASTALFWCVARGFQSKKPLRDLAVAVIVAVLVHVVFTRGLGLTLPAGILKGLL